MDSKSNSNVSKPVVAKTTYDLQRIKLEKLMKNPDKLVPIPERPKERNMPHAPDFVRNVMGSSAGAGSGEFHVYRHLRRKEYARQKYIQEKGKKDLLEQEYQDKIEHNKIAAEEKTAKKRAKRLKKKQKQKGNKKPRPTKEESSSSSEEESDAEEKDNNKNSESSKDSSVSAVTETSKPIATDNVH